MPLHKPHPPWRHGPMRRGTDVAQSWLTLVTGLLLVVGVPASGVAAGQAVAVATQQQRAALHRVTAVVTQQPPGPVGFDTGGAAGGRVHATVRWVTPDHEVRTGEAAVPSGVQVGDRTPVWLDRQGALVRDPDSPADTLVMGVAAGTVAACGTGLVIFGMDRAGVRLLDRKRYAQWEREWAELDAPGRHHRQ
ncbi:Rv1733c family protein [Streptomyces noursei]